MSGTRCAWASATRVVGLLLVVTLLHPAFGAKVSEPTFPVLKTRTATYTNVTVTTRSRDYIFIVHSRGMASIRISDLAPAIRRQLGYATTKPGATSKSKALRTAAAKRLEAIHHDLKPVEQSWKARWNAIRPKAGIPPTLSYAALAVTFFLYLFFCYCCQLICLKAKRPKSLLVWVPVLQLIPLFRAAGMSAWWTVACLVPLLNILAQILWSVKIVRARTKPVWVAILLLVPITNVFAFLYLAFSGSATEKTAPKVKSLVFQSA